MLAFLHKVGIFNDILWQEDLLVCFLVHKVESVLLGIEELVRAALNVDGFDFRTGGEGVFKNASVLQVAEFGLYESRSLARFYVLEPHDHTRLVIVLEIESVFKISCCCHKNICYLFK